jgi:hypothetical protein
MDTTAISEPLCLTLYSHYKENIETAREKFYKHLTTKYNETIGRAAKQRLEERVNSSPTPLFGEMLPWMLRKIFPIYSNEPSEQFDKILIEWLSFYLLQVLLNKKTKSSILMPLMAEASAYIATENWKMVARVCMDETKESHTYNKNLCIETLAGKISEQSAYADSSLVGHLTESHMLHFVLASDDMANIGEDLSFRRTSSVIKKYMLDTAHIFFESLLCDLKQRQLEHDIADPLRSFSNHAKTIAIMINEREREINRDLKKFDAFGMGPLKYNLKAEYDFFERTHEEAMSLKDFVATIAFQSNINQKTDLANEAKSRFDMLAMSM